MIISCPNCDTAYNLSENAITSEGRKIRCKRCRHVFWARRISSAADSEPKIEIYYKDQEEAKPQAGAGETAESTEKPEGSAPKATATAVSKLAGKLGGSPKPLSSRTAPLKPPTALSPKPNVTEDEKETREVERNSNKPAQPKKLSSLFGSSLSSNKSKSNEGPTEPSEADSEEQGAEGAAKPSIPFRNKKEVSHETSFGMPAITEKDRDNAFSEGHGDDAPRATSLGIPSLKNNLIPETDASTSASRKRKSTLWMLSEDEAIPGAGGDAVKALAKERNDVADETQEETKEPSEADFSDVVDAQNEPEDNLPDPSNQTSPLLNFDRESFRKGFGGSTLAQQLANNIGSKKPSPDAKDHTTNFDRDEESGRRNTTLFGLAVPISSNTTRYGEEDAAELFSNDSEFDDFFTLDGDPNQETPDLEVPENYDQHPSRAESVVSQAYTEPLKPSEKDTARRLAKFLGRMSAAQQNNSDLLDPSLQTVEQTADVTRDLARDFASGSLQNAILNETATATTRDERPPFDTDTNDLGGRPAHGHVAEPIEADLSRPIGGPMGGPPHHMGQAPHHGGAPGFPPGGRPSGPPQSRGPHSTGGVPNRNNPYQNSVDQGFGAAPPDDFTFDPAQPPGFQQPNNAWNSGRPPANFNPNIPNNGPLFDKVENTDIIRREAQEMQRASKPKLGNILIWGAIVAIVVIVGLFVAWFIVMKLL